MNNHVDAMISDAAAATQAPPPRHRNVEILLNGPIGPTLARLAAPNTIAFLVGSGVAVAEMWFVGQLGTHALAGLALGFPIFMLMMMLSAGALGGAMAAAVARAVGSHRTGQAEALAWHALIIALAAAGFFTLFYRLYGAAFYTFLGASGETLAAVIAYSDIVLVGGVVIWLVNAFSSLLRGAGDMKSPALAMLLAAAIQIPLGGALALGWGPFPRIGIAGVAWGAVIAFAIAALFLGYRLVSGRSGLRLRLAALRLRWTLFREILDVGLVASISPITSVATVIMLAGLVSGFGDAALAGFGIAARLEFLLIPIVFGIGAAMIAMVGANMGAGQLARAHRIGWTGGLAAAVIAGAIGSATALWPGAWAGLFTENMPVLMAATVYLTIVGPFYAFHGLGLSLYFASQGAGTVIWPVLFGGARLLITAGGGIVAVQSFNMGFAGLPWFVAASMAVYGLGTALSIYLGAWRHHQMVQNTPEML
ncbi:MAG: MATE family efflux transporter [Alphaproteobacteria bacterium]|nr:MATE family efflux transporter [Alphaproteobacteria bacterium]MBL6952685.1 MATE family efflux transporter [Alphaproteobacteria bacterium]